MSDIKALDKLRHHYNVAGYADLQKCCDEIEAEIAANYMRLPRDADDVPIHIGDKLIKNGIVIGSVTAVGFNGEYRVWVLPNGKNVSVSFLVEGTKHVKPRMLEDVLIDAMQFGFSSHAGDNVMEKAREFADEIRKLLLGGDE